MIFIVAETERQAQYCAKRNNLKQSDWYYVAHPHILRGYDNIIIWYYGLCENHPKYNDIEDLIHGAQHRIVSTHYVT